MKKPITLYFIPIHLNINIAVNMQEKSSGAHGAFLEQLRDELERAHKVKFHVWFSESFFEIAWWSLFDLLIGNYQVHSCNYCLAFSLLLTAFWETLKTNLNNFFEDGKFIPPACRNKNLKFLDFLILIRGWLITANYSSWTIIDNSELLIMKY